MIAFPVKQQTAHPNWVMCADKSVLCDAFDGQQAKDIVALLNAGQELAMQVLECEFDPDVKLDDLTFVLARCIIEQKGVTK